MRFTPTDVTSTYAAIAALNANFDDVAALLEKCVFTDGTAPNSMEADFDMNHFRILNLGAPQDANDAVRLTDIQQLIAANGNITSTLATTVGAAMIGTSSTGTIQASLNAINSTIGTANFTSTPGPALLGMNLDKTWVGEAANDSDYRGLLITTRFQGTNGGLQQNGLHIQNEVRNDGATVPLTFAQGCEAYVRVGYDTRASGGTIVGANVSAVNVFAGHVANESINTNIPTAMVFKAKDTDWNDVAGSNGTITSNYGFYSGNLSHGTKLTGQAFGFYAANMTLPGAGAKVAGFYTDMSLGAAKYALYMGGTAVSLHRGALRVGDLTDPVEKFEVNGNALVTGSIKSNGTLGIGYGAGAGGTVTQATNKSTAVTLNKTCGQITLNNAALAANAVAAFTLNNSTIAATDVIRVNVQSGAATPGSYLVQAENNAAGSCVITVRNLTAGSLSEALVLNFIVLKAVNA